MEASPLETASAPGGRVDEKEPLGASGLPTMLRLVRRSKPTMDAEGLKLVVELYERVRVRPLALTARSSLERRLTPDAVKDDELWREGERGYCSAVADRAESLPACTL